MAAENTVDALSCLPSAAAGASVTPSGTTWASSAWVQLSASTGTAITLVAISVNPGVAPPDFEVDIGKGGAGSEVVVGTLGGAVGSSSSTGGGNLLTFQIPISNIASGSRVSVRMRKTGTSTSAWNFALVYYSSAAPTGVTVTANASARIPSAAASTAVTPSASAWVNGSYAQLIASTSSAIVLAALIFSASAIDSDIEIDIATGAAASEVVKTTFRVVHSGAASSFGIGFIPLNAPLDNIANGARVAARIRGAATSGLAIGISIIYYNSPI